MRVRTVRRVLANPHRLQPDALTRARKTPRLLGLGAQPAANSPEEFAEFVRAEIPRWGKVVKSSGATVD